MAALRVLSGVLVPIATKRTDGAVKIRFNPFGVVNEPGPEDATLVDRSTSGAAGRFETPPGKVVSVREFRVGDKDSFFGGSQIDLFRIDDGVPDRDTITIRWRTTNGGSLHEISVLIVGEA